MLLTPTTTRFIQLSNKRKDVLDMKTSSSGRLSIRDEFKEEMKLMREDWKLNSIKGEGAMLYASPV